MSKPSANAVKELRDLTGMGLMECKKVIEEAGGDIEKAKALVIQRGKDRAQKLAGKAATEGVIGVYVHHDKKSGVMVELNCNTDFVARNPEFEELARDIAMHICAVQPEVVRREELDPALVASVKEYHLSEVPANKPAEVREKIAEGKMRSWYEQRVLLDQPWVKEPAKTIQKLIEEKVNAIRENISIARFSYFRVGATGKAEEAEQA